MSKSIGLRIATKREAKGLSQTALAGKTKVSPGQILNVEKGHSALSPELAKRLEKTLGLKFSRAELEKQKPVSKTKTAKPKKAKPVQFATRRADESPNFNAQPTWNSEKIEKAIDKIVSKRKAKSTTADPAQGILPGFSEMVAPKAAEMAREIVFKALQKAIGEEMEKVVAKLKVV